MLSIDKKPEIKRRARWQLYPWGYAIEFSLRKQPAAAGGLLRLCRAVVEEVLPLEAITAKPLIDIKGCNQPLELELVDDIASPPGTDELFYLKGCVLSEEKDENQELKIVRREFEYRIETPFLDFPGTHHIRHNTVIVASGAWPKDLNIAALQPDAPFEIHYLRFAADFFCSRFITGMLGFAPSVWKTVIFEATDNEISLKAQAEGIPRKDYDLIANEEPVGKLIKAIGGVQTDAGFSA